MTAFGQRRHGRFSDHGTRDERSRTPPAPRTDWKMTDWEGIVERDGPAVWRTVYRLLGRRADAEDCFPETFLAALELWRRQPVRHPHAMLQRLATARAVDRLRRRYREAGRIRSTDWDVVANAEPSPPQRAVAAELS